MADRPSEPEVSFERSFIAVSYLLERRGEDLVAPLKSPSATAAELVRRLGHTDRQVRARTLAAELALVVASLEKRSFV